MEERRSEAVTNDIMNKEQFIQEVRKMWPEVRENGKFVVSDKKIKRDAKTLKRKYPDHTWEQRLREYKLHIALSVIGSARFEK